MVHSSSVFSTFLVFVFLHSYGHGAGNFRIDIYHKFSNPVKRWVAGGYWHGFRLVEWPTKGSIEYYTTLLHHDRVLLRGRGLEEEELTFSEGNKTLRLNQLGFLHYAVLSLGTPAQDFVVALDTGSDLFWVPCECIQCAPISSSSYGFSFQFNVYSRNASSTSRNISCDNSLCEGQSRCLQDDTCPYNVEYLSSNTSSSGVLVEDVLKLLTEDGRREHNAQVTFGCGSVQTGSFLDAAAPNGLLGLGLNNISVPSILSRLGMAKNSFSMCFGSNGVGRIVFGDKGSSDQEETPLNIRQSLPTYNISITGLRVGSKSIDTSFNAIFDSGFSFTTLADPIYTILSDSFNSQTTNKRQPNVSEFPFEYCYLMSYDDNIPSINLTMKGGSQFSVLDPIIAVMDMQVYCLAIVKSSKLSVIGQNFMTGKQIVFDREKFILGWKDFNCYEIDNSAAIPVGPVVPSSYNPKSNAPDTNGSPVSDLPVPSNISHSSRFCSWFMPCHLLLFFFHLQFFDSSFRN